MTFADFDHLPRECGQRLAHHLVRQYQDPRKVGEIVGERVELQADGVGLYRVPGQSASTFGSFSLAQRNYVKVE